MTKLEQTLNLKGSWESKVPYVKKFTPEQIEEILKQKEQEKLAIKKWTKEWIRKHNQALKTQGWE